MIADYHKGSSIVLEEFLSLSFSNSCSPEKAF